MPENTTFNGIPNQDNGSDKAVAMLQKVAEATSAFSAVDAASMHEDHAKDFTKAQELANELSFKVTALIKDIQTRSSKVSSRFASTRNVVGGYAAKIASGVRP